MAAEPRGDRSIGTLFSELANETSTLIRQEILLAKVEFRQKASEAGKQFAWVAVGGALAYAGLLTVIGGIVFLLALFVPLWASALIVGVAVLGIGYLLIRRHLDALKNVDPAPRATMETLREDKEWAKEQLR